MGQDVSELGPGLHVYTAVAALEHAGRLAAELHADLCVTAAEADAILAERQALPSLQGADLLELRTLAGRVVTADRIVGETRVRVAAEVAERLAETGAGMAIHPTTIRERAAALLQARMELAQAEQLLVAQDEMQAQEAERAASALAAAPSPMAPAPAPSQPAAHVAAASAHKRGFLGRFRRVASDEPEDTSASSDILRQMSAATDEAFGARRAAEVRDDQRTLLDARRSAAEEQVRVAARSWRELAGEGVGPEDVEAVVRRYDPQHQEALVVAEDTVHVRSVNRLLQDAIERWNAAWERLGLEAPPPSVAGTVVEELARSLTKPIVAVGDAIDTALDMADSLPTTPVVVVEDAHHPDLDATMPEPERSGIEVPLEADPLDDDVS